MNVCKVCGYKVISNAAFERHLLTHEVPVNLEEKTVTEDLPKSVAETPVETPVEAPVEAPVVPDEEIVIHFSKPVEIQINGIHYDGKDIKVKDMSVASEIVRIAREAYGKDILL